jgi:tRNA nucleotidyltransferase (CCA-adding enzyme)
MVELHMRPNLLVANNAKTKSFMRTFDTSCCPNDLLLLAKADSLGRADEQGHMPLPEEGYRDIEQRLGELFAEYERRMAAPYVTGNDLIEAGYEPGPLFSEALAYAHKLRLAGIGRDEQLSQTLGYMRSL